MPKPNKWLLWWTAGGVLLGAFGALFGSAEVPAGAVLCFTVNLAIFEVEAARFQRWP